MRARDRGALGVVMATSWPVDGRKPLSTSMVGIAMERARECSRSDLRVARHGVAVLIDVASYSATARTTEGVGHAGNRDSRTNP